MKPGAELFQLQAKQLVDDIRTLFVGKHPAVIGTALAELLARHLAGARPDLQHEAYAEFLTAVDEMIPEAERLVFPDGLPPSGGIDSAG